MNNPLIQTAVLAAAEKAINSALQLDPGTLLRLRKLEGKVFQIACTAPTLSLLLLPDHSGVILQSDHSDTNQQAADCCIKGDSTSLIRLMTAENKAEALFSPDIKLTGNTEDAQQLQTILGDLDIDWEEKLSHWVGDIAAHQIGNQARAMFRWGQQTFDSLLMNLEEYLHEEARSMPPRLELEAFYEDIEELSLATDRLDARLQRLSAKKENRNNQAKEDTLT